MFFQKFRETDSAIALRDIYGLFRNGMVNMVKTYDEHGSHSGWKSCVTASDQAVPEIAKGFKEVDWVIQSLQDHLSYELETEVTIHDIEFPAKEYQTQTRSASFITKMSDGSEKVFLVQVGTEYVDPDGGTAGWTSWRLMGASFSYRGRTTELRPGWLLNREEREEVPALVRERIMSYVTGTRSSGSPG